MLIMGIGERSRSESNACDDTMPITRSRSMLLMVEAGAMPPMSPELQSALMPASRIRLRPAVDLALQERGELLGRIAGGHVDAQLGEALLHLRGSEDLHHLGIQAVHDLARRARDGEHAEPDAHVVARHCRPRRRSALLGRRGCALGRHARSPSASRRARAAARSACCRTSRPPGRRSGRSRPARCPCRDMRNVGLGHCLEQLERQMLRGAVARRGVVELPGIRLRVRRSAP